MMQHKENVLPQPAKPAAFCCIKNKKKIKKISKIQHINIRSQKGAKKGAEPKKGEAWKQKKEKVKNERYPK